MESKAVTINRYYKYEQIAERIRDNLHELSKTGRWLGGTTPTGYRSESFENLSVDGKTRKACKLAIVAEEAAIVRLIYSKFLEMNSLTKTETFLLQNGYKSKNGKPYTRFAIKNILMNPVYLIADETAYKYWRDNEADYERVVCFRGQARGAYLRG